MDANSQAVDLLDPKLKSLMEEPSVTWLRPTSRQTLVHMDHHAPGVFLVLEGSIRLRGNRKRTETDRNVTSSALGFPPLGELDARTARAVSVAPFSTVLYIPRSLLQFSPAVLRIIEDAPIHWVSLTTPQPPTTAVAHVD